MSATKREGAQLSDIVPKERVNLKRRYWVFVIERHCPRLADVVFTSDNVREAQEEATKTLAGGGDVDIFDADKREFCEVAGRAVES